MKIADNQQKKDWMGDIQYFKNHDCFSFLS